MPLSLAAAVVRFKPKARWVMQPLPGTQRAMSVCELRGTRASARNLHKERKMNLGRVAGGLLLIVGCMGLLAGDASAAMARPAWRQRQDYRAPAAAAAPTGQQNGQQGLAQQNMTARRGSTATANSYPAGRGGWNASNNWYTPQAPYGNYAPPAYATSRSALIQIGPVPALGGVRSLPGWGGAR
jgi:hypothetical protein